MKLSFEVLSTRHLDWLRSLRNQNRKWFLDSREIEKQNQEVWFRASSNNGDLNLVIKGEEEEKRVGFISVYNIKNNTASIGRMMIDDEFKHQGYMERAMIYVFDICRLLGLKTLSLEVKHENTNARSLYTKMGFVTYGYTPGTITMRKML